MIDEKKIRMEVLQEIIRAVRQNMSSSFDKKEEEEPKAVIQEIQEVPLEEVPEVIEDKVGENLDEELDEEARLEKRLAEIRKKKRGK